MSYLRTVWLLINKTSVDFAPQSNWHGKETRGEASEKFLWDCKREIDFGTRVELCRRCACTTQPQMCQAFDEQEIRKIIITFQRTINTLTIQRIRVDTIIVYPGYPKGHIGICICCSNHYIRYLAEYNIFHQESYWIDTLTYRLLTSNISKYFCILDYLSLKRLLFKFMASYWRK